jgi:hypothetical protein
MGNSNPNNPLVSAPRGGRPPGAVNRVKREASELARRMVESESYQTWLWERIVNRTLQPETEKMLWGYAFGQPPAHMHVTASREDADLSGLSNEELARMAQDIAVAALEADATDAMYDAHLAAVEAQIARRELEAATGNSGADGE